MFTKSKIPLRNLMYLQNHPEEASSLNIDFTAMLGEMGGQVELKPGGSEIQVFIFSIHDL